MKCETKNSGFLFMNELGICDSYNTSNVCLPVQAGIRDVGSIPGSGRSPGEGHGALQATVHRVAQIWTWLKWPSTHSYLSYTFSGWFYSLQVNKSLLLFSSLLRDYLLLCLPKKIKTSYLGIPPFFIWASMLHILSCLKIISHQTSGSFLLPFLLESSDYHLSQLYFQLL